MDNEKLIQEIEELKKEVSNLKANAVEGRKGRFRRFMGTAFRRLNIVIGIAITTVISSLILYAATVEKPFDFKEGEIISAEEVNSNFNVLFTAIEDLYKNFDDINGAFTGIQQDITDIIDGLSKIKNNSNHQTNTSTDSDNSDLQKDSGWFLKGNDIVYDRGKVLIKNQLIVPSIKGSSSGCTLVMNGYKAICNDSDPIIIPDNHDTIQDTIMMPDMGKIDSMNVSVNITSSDISGIMIVLIDPDNNDYVLYDGGSHGGIIDTSFPDLTPLASGDLSSWTGRNPEGEWTIEVTDNSGRKSSDDSDGALLQWCVNIRAADSHDISVRNGDFTVDGYVGIGTSDPRRRLHVNDVLRLEPTPNEPENPSAGDMYFDSEINKLRVYDGNDWQECW